MDDDWQGGFRIERKGDHIDYLVNERSWGRSTEMHIDDLGIGVHRYDAVPGKVVFVMQSGPFHFHEHLSPADAKAFAFALQRAAEDEEMALHEVAQTESNE